MPFTQANVLDLPDLDVPIYRIFPLGRFEQVMTTKRLVLVKPSAWEDEFENFLLQATAHIGGNELASLESLRNKLYGQSWMLCPDSEAMWKLYSFPTRFPEK